MKAGRSLAILTAAWEQLLAAVTAHQADLPEVEAYRVQLEASLEDVRAAHARRASLEAEKLRATQAVNLALDHGKALASRLRIWVRGVYGLHSDKLVEFGIKPLGRRRAVRGGRRDEKKAPRSAIRTVR
jgi:hypothetical protein